MKKLNVEAVVIDLRHVSEETLASYEHIQIHAALAMTSPKTEALLAKYPVELDVTSVQCYDDDAKVNMVNGKTELTASHKPEGKSVLIVNGKANIAADAADTLRAYGKIIVNGKVLCPAGLAGLVTEKCTINGKLAVYPDEAVVLKGTVKLDRSFLLRAQARLYWTEKQFVAVDPKLDTAALAAKGVRFAATKAILLESLAETLAPLFTEETELIVLPEGTAVVDDDFELTPKTFRRYGTKLYVMGDVNISNDAADLLEQVEYLHASGDVSLPAALEDAFYAIPDVEYQDLQLLTGHVVMNKPLLNVKQELLELDPAGITCVNCAVVALDKALTAEDILAKLHLNCCAVVRCTAAQEAAVEAAAVNVAQIKVTDAKEEKDPDTLSRSGVELTL
ncbi:MAG: hypothetical protein ACLS5B_04935 [Faecalibacterium prausnitzii]